MSISLEQAIIELSVMAQKLNSSNTISSQANINVIDNEKEININSKTLNIQNANKFNIQDKNNFVINGDDDKIIIKQNNSEIILSDDIISINSGKSYIVMGKDTVIINSQNAKFNGNLKLNSEEINFSTLPRIFNGDYLSQATPGMMTPFVSNNSMPIPSGWSVCNEEILLLRSINYGKNNPVPGYNLTKSHFNDKKVLNSERNIKITVNVSLIMGNTTNNNEICDFEQVELTLPVALLIEDQPGINNNISSNFISPNVNLNGPEYKDIKGIYPFERIIELNGAIFNNDLCLTVVNKYNILKYIVQRMYCYQPSLINNILIKGTEVSNNSLINSKSRFEEKSVNLDRRNYWYNGQYIMKF